MHISTYQPRVAKGRGHGTRLGRGHSTRGIYQSKGNLVRRGGTKGRRHGSAQPWRVPDSNLVTNIGDGTNPHMSSVQGQRDYIQVYHS